MGKKKGKGGGGEAGPAVENLKHHVDGNAVDLSHQNRDTAPVDALAANLLVTRVDLSGNTLVTLPQDFGRLDHLVRLNLSKNGLTELPDSFGELTSLRWLDLFSNELTRLPYTFANLKDLKWLDLKGNRIVDGFISQDLIGPCSDDAECKACAKRVLVRVAELWAKRQKNDERLERKKQRELEEQQAALKQKKAEEKARRKAEWLKAQEAKMAERSAQQAQATDDSTKDSDSDTKGDEETVSKGKQSVLQMLRPLDAQCHLTWCGAVVVVLLLPMVLLLIAGAHKQPL